MALFASKTPRDLNHDPEPWQEGWPSLRRFAEPNTFSIDSRTERAHKPRPEFDHVQHNEPNPILVELRQVMSKRPSLTYRLADENFSHSYTFAGHYITQDYERITDGPTLVHAYKVLSRLARMEARS